MADERLEYAQAEVSTQKAQEEILIDKAKKGDREAFSKLMKLNQDAIFNATYRICGDFNQASEITQRVFINAYRKICDFRSECALSTWLYRIAFNQSISLAREQSRHKTLPFVTDEDGKVISAPADYSLNPVNILERNEQQQIIQNALLELDEMDRKLVILKDIDNLCYSEIGDVFNIDVSTVRSRLHRARLRLKEKLIDKI